MSIELEAFNPYEYKTITATTTSANVAFSTNVGKNLRMFNSGTSVGYLTWGNGASQTATSTTGYPLGPGVTEIVKTGGIDNVAGIVLTGSANIYVVRGDGI